MFMCFGVQTTEKEFIERETKMEVIYGAVPLFFLCVRTDRIVVCRCSATMMKCFIGTKNTQQVVGIVSMIILR